MSDEEEVKYAVVRVRGKEKAVGLLQFLLSNGYPDVSFVSDLVHVGFKSDPFVEPSSSKVTSSSAAGPSTSAVSTTTDPIPSTPPHSSYPSSPVDEEQKKTEPASPQPTSRELSPQEKKPDTGVIAAVPVEPSTSDQEKEDPISPPAPNAASKNESPKENQQGSTDSTHSVVSIDAAATHTLQQRSPVGTHDAPSEVSDAAASLPKSTSAEKSKKRKQPEASSPPTTPSRPPQRWNQQVKPSDKAASSTPSPAKKPSPQWLQKPQPTVDSGTRRRNDQPVIFDPAKWQLARERAEMEGKDTSYRRNTTAGAAAASSSSGPSTSTASTAGSASTSVPTTTSANVISVKTSPTAAHPQQLIPPQKANAAVSSPAIPPHQHHPPLFHPHFFPHGGPPIPRMPNLQHTHPHLYGMMQTGPPPHYDPRIGLIPMQAIHGMPRPFPGMLPVPPQLTPSQAKVLNDALNYTLGQINPELKATCQRIGVTEAQLVHFMATFQRQTNAGASTSAAAAHNDDNDDSDGVEVLKVVPTKKKRI